MKIIGVTACPSGVAHTYMAAEALMLAGKKAGVEVKIETQGSAGIENQLTEADVKEAACVILSNDVAIRDDEKGRCTDQEDPGYISVGFIFPENGW